MPLDDNVYDKLNNLTIPKLCIRMNTLKVSEYNDLLMASLFLLQVILQEQVHLVLLCS